MPRLTAWASAYRTPVWLSGLFLLLLLVLALVPTGSTAEPEAVELAGDPTPGPRECAPFACGIDQRCDPASGRCVLVDHTPLPCVPTARFDAEAGFCLPEGAPPPPAPQPTVEPQPQPQQPRMPGGGISGGRERIPRMPGMGN